MTLPVFFRRILPYLAALVILLLAALAFQVLVRTQPNVPAEPVREQTWVVDTLSAELETIAPQITLYGQIESPRTAQLSAAVTAFVSQLPVREGHRVEQGDLLLALDPSDSQLVVTQRQAELADIEARIDSEHTRHGADLQALAIERELLTLSQRSLKRFKELQGRQVSSQTQLDEAQRAYQQQALALTVRQREIDEHPNRLKQLNALARQARSRVAAAQLDLARTDIRAPFTGRVARIDVAPGDRVRSGDLLLVIYDTAALEARAQIPSRWLNRVRQALAQGRSLKAEASLDGYPLALTLMRLAGQVGNGRAGLDALFQIDASSSLTPELGRTLELSLTLPPLPGVLAVPPQALYGTDRIYRIREGRLDPLAVERVGEFSGPGGSRILVRGDAIEPGDTIVTTQLPNAIGGLKVSPVDG